MPPLSTLIIGSVNTVTRLFGSDAVIFLIHPLSLRAITLHGIDESLYIFLSNGRTSSEIIATIHGHFKR
jgi:hypothetical protein